MSITTELRHAKNQALSQLTSLRDEARLKLHLLSLEARQRWDELEAALLSLEQHATREGEKASEELNENVNKLSRSFADFIASQMSVSAGLLTNVRSLMTTQVHACGADDPLSRAAQLMWETDCGVVPVTEDTKVIGLLTDRDICMASYTQGKAPAEIRVGDVMSKSVYTCALDDSVGTALSLMGAEHLRRLPITAKDGRLVGILSLADIARWARSAPAPAVQAALTETLADISQRAPTATPAAAE